MYYTYKNPTTGYSYSGKWSSSKWNADYYSKKDFMYLNGAIINQNSISNERWILMCKYYFGVITESEYCDAVLKTERAAANTIEWWLDEGSFTVGEYTTYASSFSSKMRWEFFMLYCHGRITAKEYNGLMGNYVDDYEDWDLPSSGYDF